jgi:hypothetical protein
LIREHDHRGKDLQQRCLSLQDVLGGFLDREPASTVKPRGTRSGDRIEVAIPRGKDCWRSLPDRNHLQTPTP